MLDPRVRIQNPEARRQGARGKSHDWMIHDGRWTIHDFFKSCIMHRVSCNLIIM